MEQGMVLGAGSNLFRYSDYVQPLLKFLASLPQDEKLILVGQSFGGYCISLAMENFPEKIQAAVFVSAFMPNHSSTQISYLLREFNKRSPINSYLDCNFNVMEGAEKPTTWMSFGPLFLAWIYQNCLPEDLELAKMLVRPHGLFRLSDEDYVLTKGNFGSANRVFVICAEDESINEDFQRWMIGNSPPNEVRYISKAGHMVMLSMPKQLCQCLLEIVENYQ